MHISLSAWLTVNAIYYGFRAAIAFLFGLVFWPVGSYSAIGWQLASFYFNGLWQLGGGSTDRTRGNLYIKMVLLAVSIFMWELPY